MSHKLKLEKELFDAYGRLCMYLAFGKVIEIDEQDTERLSKISDKSCLLFFSNERCQYVPSNWEFGSLEVEKIIIEGAQLEVFNVLNIDDEILVHIDSKFRVITESVYSDDIFSIYSSFTHFIYPRYESLIADLGELFEKNNVILSKASKLGQEKPQFVGKSKN